MNIFKKILKWSLLLISFPILYLIISLLLGAITIPRKDISSQTNQTIYLSTNGIHLDIILQKKDINPELLKGLTYSKNDNFISFGWGDENFYINTPNWGDLTFNNAFKALFLKSSTLMHVTNFASKQNDWVKIEVSKNEIDKIVSYLNNTFLENSNGNKQLLIGKGYSNNDNFYKANGSYSCLKTCNSWVNIGFKKSGLKACYWTPFDFALLKKYN